MKNELLTMNPKALQFLHHARGFDFCKPYEIHRIDGRFTFNQVKKLIPEGHAAALLVCWDDSTLRYVRTDELIFVTLTDSGFDADKHDFVDYWKYRGIRNEVYSIDYEIGKSTFEERRKKAARHCFVIHQLREYMEIPMRGVPIDDNTRYTFRVSCSDLYIKRRDYNDSEFQYNKYDSFCRKKTAPADCIDKSGYLIDRRRADLYRRAAALKAQRAKAAADVADYTDIYNELCADLKRNREQLAAAVLDPDGYENMSQYARRCYDLGHAQDYLDSYVERVKNKTFKSPAAMLQYLDHARRYIHKEV